MAERQPPHELQVHVNELAYLLDQVEDDVLRNAIFKNIEDLTKGLAKQWRGSVVAFSNPVPDDAASLF